MQDNDQSHWISGLSNFLEEKSGVAAIVFDEEKQSVSIATIGKVNIDLLEKELTHTILAIEKKIADGDKGGNAYPSNALSIKKVLDQTLLEKRSCPTGPLLWKWRSVEWPEFEEEETGEEWSFLAWMAGICGVFGLAGFLLNQNPGFLPPSASIACFIIAMIAGGWDPAVDVCKKLPKGQLDIHFLMLFVAIGTAVIGRMEEGTLLLFLFSLSGSLEHFALFRTRGEMDALFKMAPKTAVCINSDGQEITKAIEDIQLDDILLIRNGDVFPVDGEIIEGSTAADESNLTGEANPVNKSIGDKVFSGTINLWGTVRAKTIKIASESALQKIIYLIRDAQHLKAPSEKFTEKFGTPYTYGILCVTSILFLIFWLILGLNPIHSTESNPSAFFRAMSFLVVASPCALVLSIPSAILAAIAWGARHGILFRGGAAIEKLGQIKVLALDKTGTLTTGQMIVDKIESFPPGKENDILELAYSLESEANHPIARAITIYGKQQNITAKPIENFKSLIAQGVQGKHEDAMCILGRRELIEEGPLKEWIQKVEHPSAEFSEVWVIYKNLIGRILLKDQIRKESKAVLEELRRNNIKTVMLTGDRSKTAQAVASELGIEEVLSSLTPQGKVDAIQDLSINNTKVAMLGDGVNDAPCLASAYVSVAMGARGSDAAMEQSEIVLMDDRIEKFLDAFHLSKRARTIIAQNLILSLGTVAIMSIASITGYANLTESVIAHEGSTVLVCLNSLRLLFHKSRVIVKSDS